MTVRTAAAWARLLAYVAMGALLLFTVAYGVNAWLEYGAAREAAEIAAERAARAKLFAESAWWKRQEQEIDARARAEIAAEREAELARKNRELLEAAERRPE